MKTLKYLIPFVLSLIVFAAIGFSPTDCVPENGAETCDIPDQKIDFSNCQYKGFLLHGKIKYVTDFPDIKVQVVEHFPDLKVKIVEHFPDECGEWQVVDDFPDIKVQIVEHFPDIKIKYVEHFPGKP